MAKQKEYRIRYEIDVIAESKMEAALKAYEIMRDDHSIPPVLYVEKLPLRDEGELKVIDLEKVQRIIDA